MTPLDRYPPPTAAVTEDELLRSAATGYQARPCACGGVVVALVEDPAEGVAAHQASVRHVRWQEWQDEVTR